MHDSTITIRPPTRWGSLGFRELVRYRELLYFLTKRELQIRYKQSLFGVGWAVLQPLALMGIFYVFFGRIANIPSDDLPYPVFALAGLVPWAFFNQSVSQSAQSLVADANIVSKVYFPRLILPIGRVLSMLVDLVIALVVLMLFMLLYGLTPDPKTVLVPFFLLLGVVAAFGAGILLAVVNVRYRDVVVAVPLLMQLWLFATPVIYPVSLLGGDWEYLLAANPMASVVTGVRWAVLDSTPPSALGVAISVGAALLLLTCALVYFRRAERHFADII